MYLFWVISYWLVIIYYKFVTLKIVITSDVYDILRTYERSLIN